MFTFLQNDNTCLYKIGTRIQYVLEKLNMITNTLPKEKVFSLQGYHLVRNLIQMSAQTQWISTGLLPIHKNLKTVLINILRCYWTLAITSLLSASFITFRRGGSFVRVFVFFVFFYRVGLLRLQNVPKICAAIQISQLKPPSVGWVKQHQTL